MSLKLVHVLFIALSTLMAVGLGIWALTAWRADGASGWLALAVIAFLGGCALVVYGGRFLQKFRKFGIAGLLVTGALGFPHDALACPACVGTTSSTLQTGMNMGIFALLGVIGFVAVCFASFFIYLALRARRAQGGVGFQVPGSGVRVPGSRSASAFVVPEGGV